MDFIIILNGRVLFEVIRYKALNIIAYPFL